jgi:RNA recognition motif-containing protein
MADKMDKLEKFVTENRAAFDDAQPNPLMWLDIEKKLEAQKNKRSRLITLYRPVAIAASFILVLGVGMLIGLNINKPSGQDLLAANPQYQEFQQAEKYFQKQVNVKLDMLKDYPGAPEVTEDLSQLDVVYNEMKAELLNSPNKDNSAIIQAMIENYQIRINMLEKILQKINNKASYHEDNISL